MEGGKTLHAAGQMDSTEGRLQYSAASSEASIVDTSTMQELQHPLFAQVIFWNFWPSDFLLDYHTVLVPVCAFIPYYGYSTRSCRTPPQHRRTRRAKEFRLLTLFFLCFVCFQQYCIPLHAALNCIYRTGLLMLSSIKQGAAQAPGRQAARGHELGTYYGGSLL